ncbi:Ada metal-binding domain-containing protein [Sulfobacillus harzensis]|uniref:Methylphosphotriester-DNA--protein-cysteine methyltransferase family protein n=1 Tax=Sulfobacillus harzensis TaxID=2729629 RepID=A0A7Y0L5E7_9FIRM|nr:Ada metal-binding domain-containing protein [Sulfobacillus harzensis]NMP23051.1 methylphosphotriester-DNA--protein-cysteine methyltransferase family protein [Sulfobacillus harzensis]
MEVTDALYAAILARDSRFDGIYFIGIASTKIVCFPSCHSKIPRRENIHVFRSLDAARRAGFRPCKRCRPDSRWGQTPDAMLASRALSLLYEVFPTALPLHEAARRLHVSPRQLSRTLNRVWHMSWHARYDALWQERATDLLGDTSVTIRAVAERLQTRPSYFTRRFHKLVGQSPAQFRCNMSKGGIQ